MGGVDSGVRLSLLLPRGLCEPPRQPSRFVTERVLNVGYRRSPERD